MIASPAPVSKGKFVLLSFFDFRKINQSILTFTFVLIINDIDGDRFILIRALPDDYIFRLSKH